MSIYFLVKEKNKEGEISVVEVPPEVSEKYFVYEFCNIANLEVIAGIDGKLFFQSKKYKLHKGLCTLFVSS